MPEHTRAATSRVDAFLRIVERGGNALPHPATLFAMMAVAVVITSAVGSLAGVTVTHPGTGQPIAVVNLISIEGLHRILTNMVSNFTGFAPLGTVLVAMLGIAVAEGAGLIGAALRLLVLAAPARLLTFAVVFAGVMSNTGGEIGYVLLVPLAALVFKAVGRHPIAGLAAAFAGVSGGYSANLLLGTLDPLLAGLSEEAARIIDPAYEVNATANWYIMSVSTFFIAATGTFVTERVVVPRLGTYAGGQESAALQPLAPEERRGLWWTLAMFMVLVGLLLAGLVPEWGFLRDPETRGVLRSPFMSGIVALIFVCGAALGLAYGFGARTIRSDADVMNAMGKAMSTLGIYMVLVFFAAQFVAYFTWTNLGLVLAVKGAEVLQASGLGTIPLVVAFVILTAFVNLFMGSASAKWAVMAPVFVPMFMLLGYTPEFTQAIYRIGDSVTNIVSPMMSYFALIVAFVQQYDPRAGIGTIVATMLPYTVAFFLVWVALMVAWVAFGLPVGPGASLYLAS
jgi:aminobenzoyl-glutamate transport protein